MQRAKKRCLIHPYCQLPWLLWNYKHSRKQTLSSPMDRKDQKVKLRLAFSLTLDEKSGICNKMLRCGVFLFGAPTHQPAMPSSSHLGYLALTLQETLSILWPLGICNLIEDVLECWLPWLFPGSVTFANLVVPLDILMLAPSFSSGAF